ETVKNIKTASRFTSVTRAAPGTTGNTHSVEEKRHVSELEQAWIKASGLSIKNWPARQSRKWRQPGKVCETCYEGTFVCLVGRDADFDLIIGGMGGKPQAIEFLLKAQLKGTREVANLALDHTHA
ncbi:unnamed protein product, partial [Hydatigera taeniaeformis]|uniref:Nitrogenase cofactor biosynthesis protein NifB n=1 Tax=Hydatigena taeniaeformis TaxID=6205 RepID=A0A0R3WLI6_HYDTA